jgi:hypothetical protein
MTKKEIVDRLTALKEETDHKVLQKEIKNLSDQFYELTNAEEKELQVKNNNSEEEELHVLPEEEVQLNDQIRESLTALKVLRNELKDQQDNMEKENLSKKQVILKRFQMLLQEEENIGKLFSSIKEIREEWKTIGEIPKAKYQDLQSQYSQLNELFNYNVNIYKELQENDLKRNYSLKNQLIHKAKELLNESSLGKLDKGIKEIQNEWEEIGPTFTEHWEKIKEEYWETVRAIYDKIKDLRDGREKEKEANYEKKKGLVEQAKALVENLPNGHKEWNNVTKALNDLQETWKKVGYAPKEVNDKVWAEFRKPFDRFFEAKGKFYASQKEGNDDRKDAKEKIIERAEELVGMTDWRKGTDLAKKLQREWQKVGHAGQYAEQRLWKAFRAKCDAFFEAKDKHFAEMDAANQENLTKKEALIEEIKAFEKGEETKANIDALKAFAARFAEIGNVPFKEKDRVYKAYKSALDEQYDKLKLDGKEKEKVLFQAKLDSIKGAANPVQMLRKEKDFIRKKINHLTKEIANFENNLGFFGNSKGAEALLSGVMKNIEKGKSDIEALKNKLKSLSKLEQEATDTDN